jgi:cytochrome c oxidase cbb3-type subunit 3
MTMAKKPDAPGPRVDQPTGTEFVGHEWDGIEELNTPLPRWWLLTFYATIIWALAYTVMFPAWPMISRATAGITGWTSHGQLASELKAQDAKRAPIIAAIAATPIEQLPAKPALMNAAVEGGRAAFKVNCVQCHGSGAAGSKGYPNLNDDDWLWGGDLKAIRFTLEHGIRNPDHAATRQSQMPAFAGILSDAEVSAVVAHVRTISGQRKADRLAQQGAALFATNCAVCHGPQGKGNRQVGAPNLTDGIWLYGGDTATLTETVLKARQGVMPRWGHKLSPATITMLAAYVHALGGGEASPAPQKTAAAHAQPE